MWPLIIRLLYSALSSNDIRVLIIGLLKNYSKDVGLKAVLDSENVSSEEIDQPYSVFNPNIIKKFLSILKPSELTELKSQLDKMMNLPNNLKNAIKPNEVNYVQSKLNKIDNLTNEKPQSNTNLNNEEITKDEKGWVILSSSWLKKGLYYTNNKSQQSGLLQVLIQSDTSKNKRWYGPYTYPAVPNEVWVLMQSAKGKNGTGAGTVFWRYFLHQFLPTSIRNYVKKQLKEQKGITKGKQRYNLIKSTNINVLKTTAFINRLERGFFKMKEFKKLPKVEIGSIAYKNQRKQVLMNVKNNRQHITYKKWK